jgi:hypothetical protein
MSAKGGQAIQSTAWAGKRILWASDIHRLSKPGEAETSGERNGA